VVAALPYRIGAGSRQAIRASGIFPAGGLGGAVEDAIGLAVLPQPVGGNQRLELITGDEVVVLAINLTLAGRAGRDRHTGVIDATVYQV